MIYMGSKNKIASEIIPFMLPYFKKYDKYVEPFCGGCNMIDKISPKIKRYANDSNRYLIALLKYVSDETAPALPGIITKDEYDKVNAEKDKYPDWYVGYIGFICSFRGKFFNGYMSTRTHWTTGKDRNYQEESISNLSCQIPFLKGIKFSNMNYRDLPDISNSVIYCDPPYAGTTKYKVPFDYEEFWDWCRKMSLKNKIFISEYHAPDDFKCIWTKRVNVSLSGSNSKSATEKLFTIEREGDIKMNSLF